MVEEQKKLRVYRLSSVQAGLQHTLSILAEIICYVRLTIGQLHQILFKTWLADYSYTENVEADIRTPAKGASTIKHN